MSLSELDHDELMQRIRSDLEDSYDEEFEMEIEDRDSPTDLGSDEESRKRRSRWEDYTKAKEVMLERTHIHEAPWWVVQAIDKKTARLNCIAHLLKHFPYVEMEKPPVVLPERVRHEHYSRQAVPKEMLVPEIYG